MEICTLCCTGPRKSWLPLTKLRPSSGASSGLTVLGRVWWWWYDLLQLPSLVAYFIISVSNRALLQATRQCRAHKSIQICGGILLLSFSKAFHFGKGHWTVPMSWSGQLLRSSSYFVLFFMCQAITNQCSSSRLLQRKSCAIILVAGMAAGPCVSCMPAGLASVDL